ncbi:MAG: hypothetical protein HN726_00680 [Candidatus Magasanikbacteria bacterium]|jgi:hypothetical protein|nr:hypothetical protein [Candidatus Magasanikbacteria bacterium]MBT4220712.1 hypothetical protein [Candidatus Magasanikbacteria bacterium]MBT4350057.1 hypothetical protein [Candidatus Magasanikbacteria bacterium]MBT4541500.1 hypothetical protein [Candidatus Magasanikbacteria bacterium]MBT6253028.1 hypothetical protein [Candidatus Magasanikbacteria bacterium]
MTNQSNNYQAWNDALADFPHNALITEQLSFLLRYAVLAPSTLNSQPWHFIVHEHTVLVQPDLSRWEEATDLSQRQMYISIGAAIENFIIAASYFGLSVSTSLSPFDNGLFSVLLVCEQSHGKMTALAPLCHAISSRSTHRGLYRSEEISPSLLRRICEISYDTSIHIIRDRRQRLIVGDIMLESGMTAFSFSSLRRGISRYKRSNLTRDHIGIPGNTMGFSLIKSFVAPLAIRLFNVVRLNYKQQKDMLRSHTPYFVVLSAKTDTCIDWINTGRTYQRISLVSESLGIRSSVWASPIEMDNGRRRLADLLSVSKPQLCMRLGYGTAYPHRSPRFPADAVTDIII